MACFQAQKMCFKTLVVFALVVSTAQSLGGDTCNLDKEEGEETDDLEQVGLIVTQVLVDHFPGCHLVLLTLNQHSRVFHSVLRRLSACGEAGVVVEVGSLFSQDQLSQDLHLLQGLWGDARTTCRALFLDLTASNATTMALDLMDASRLWQQSETGVVVLGRSVGVRGVLLHHSFRNTVHALYLALQDASLHTQASTARIKKALTQAAMSGHGVRVYRRCLYCNNGEEDVELVQHYSLTLRLYHTQHLLQEQLSDLMGHQFRVVALRHFPFMDYQTVGHEPGSTIIPTDCLDNRIIQTLAAKFNFTYTMHEQQEKEWGVPRAGVFDGMMGELQREETDFCMIAAPTPERLQAAEYARGYPSTQLVIVSLKPSLVPELFSFIRPFAVELWVALLVSVVAWGVTLWLLEKAWQWVAGGRWVALTSAFLYGWGALLNQPPSDPSVSISGQVLVGWWLIFCLIIGTAFSSSLIAHLTVQERSRTLETFQDLLNKDQWRWGTERWLLSGVPLEYFSKHFDPVVQQIYKQMKILPVHEALKNVEEGGFSFITFREYVSIVIASFYTDALGNTPFYISRTSVSMMADFGWGIRKGAPFYLQFCQLMSRLEDGGMTAYWRLDVIARRVRENREAGTMDTQATKQYTGEDGRRQVVLGMTHMQGAFYLLLVGCCIAFLTLLGENLAHCCSSPQ